MSNSGKRCCKSISSNIKSQDMFAIPVQLNYRGQTNYNTFCGGCISIILVISLTCIFGVELSRLYHEPDFQQYPPRYNFSNNRTTIMPQYGNTIAINLNNS